MTFLESLQETLNTGDPTVLTWPLVRSYWQPFVFCFLYVFFVKGIGPELMRYRKPLDLRSLMIFYNFCIVGAYTFCLSTLLYYFFSTDVYKTVCAPCVVDAKYYYYRCAAAGWFIYILKYVEFADTIFFVLRKKDHLITNLHVIHHGALPIIGWVICRSERSGFQFVPGGINSLVHIIMYTYYGLAAMGPQVQKKLWWKEHLTRLQMAQFVIILAFFFVGVAVTGCTTSMYGIYIDIFFPILFLALFYNFYKKTYKKDVKASQEEQNGHIMNSKNEHLKNIYNGRIMKKHNEHITSNHNGHVTDKQNGTVTDNCDEFVTDNQNGHIMDIQNVYI